MSLDHLELKPDGDMRAYIGESAGWRNYGLRSAERARQLCPVGKGPELGVGVSGPRQQGGGLKASMEVRFYFGIDAHIEIGSKLQTSGNNPVSLFALVELGTVAHTVYGSPLAFVPRGGVLIFRAWAKIPAHKANRFTEKAAQQILHEMSGLTLVTL